MSVLTGLDVLIRDGFGPLRGLRVGLLTNPSAVTRDLVSAYDVFRRSEAVDLRAIFSPEHGFAAAAADGVQVASSIDPRTGLPIHSLYGESLRPTPDMFDGLDMLVCDIQDIGVRYYTYAWTVSYALEGAGAAGVKVAILDRPNPLGDAVDGPLVQPGYLSIVGAQPIPVQHGLTLGELMRVVNARWNPTPAALDVIACEGYHRGTPWDETGLVFVPPSPAMPHPDTARQYPGACLIEGTNLSEGRGTSLPFEITGAPYIDDAEGLAEALNAQGIAGVRYRPHRFTPTANKHVGEVCQGVQAHVIDWNTYRPLLAWVSVIRTVRERYADHFDWRPPYADGANLPIDTLYGSDRLRSHLDHGGTLDALTDEWDAAATDWRDFRRDSLIYPAG